MSELTILGLAVMGVFVLLIAGASVLDMIEDKRKERLRADRDAARKLEVADALINRLHREALDFRTVDTFAEIVTNRIDDYKQDVKAIEKGEKPQN